MRFPRYRALLVETIDKLIYLVSADDVAHRLANLVGRYDTSHEVVELRNSNSVQL